VLSRLWTNPLARNASWMFLGYGSRILLQGLYFVLLARALGSDGLGTFAGTVALFAVISPFVGWGGGNLLIMRVARESRAYAASLGTALLLLGLTGLALTALAVGLAVSVLQSPLPLATLILLAICELLLVRLLELAAQAFQAFERLKVTARLLVLGSGLRLAAVFAFLLFTPGGSIATWVQWYAAATAVASGVAVWMMLRHLGAPRLTLRLSRTDLKEGFFFALGVSSKSVYTDADKSMLLRLGSSEAAGIYTASYRIIAMAFTPVQALLAAGYARFFRAGAQGVSAAAGFAGRLAVPAIGYGLVVLLALVALAPLLPILLGEDFREATQVVRFLAALPLVQSVHYLLADALTGAGLQAWRSGAQIGAALLNVALNLWLIPAHAWQGAAAATLLSELALLFSLAAILIWYQRKEAR
jgi:O-antigen/teichoic acid export membrane protein